MSENDVPPCNDDKRKSIIASSYENLFDPPPQSVVKAILHIMKSLTTVVKSSKNPVEGYTYANNADLIAALHPLLVEAEIMINPHLVGLTADASDNPVCMFRFVISHVSGESWVYPGVWLGVANDYYNGRLGDKWFQKSATAAEKYFLIKLFKISTPDDIQPLNDGDTDADSVKGIKGPQRGRDDPLRREAETNEPKVSSLLSIFQKVSSIDDFDLMAEKHKEELNRFEKTHPRLFKALMAIREGMQNAGK